MQQTTVRREKTGICWLDRCDENTPEGDLDFTTDDDLCLEPGITQTRRSTSISQQVDRRGRAGQRRRDFIQMNIEKTEVKVMKITNHQQQQQGLIAINGET
ncbi:unnamed protein product [Heterobilharzia americana]|nr:unnamed protein product [Heterobilharzia americana]